MRTAALAFLALPCTVVWCSCRHDPSAGHDSPPAESSSARSTTCGPLAPETSDAWAPNHLAFGQVQVPSAWRQIPVQGGVEFRDPAVRRRVFFSEVLFPASAGLSPEQALQRVLLRVRPRLAGSDLGVELGPVVKTGSPDQPAVSFLSTAHHRTISSAIIARKTDDSGVRLISATYEEDNPAIAPSCVDSHAATLLSRVEVSASPAGSGDSPAAASLVRFSPAASAELARQMKSGDVVWVAASREGRDVRFHLELRTPDDVPADAVRDRIDGVSVAVDRPSMAMIDGATIDYSAEGGGFVVSNPGAR